MSIEEDRLMSVVIAPEKLEWLENLHLDRGGHKSPEEGACVLEAVAYVAGEPFSDHPACASPILTSFLISWNDSLNDAERQMLKPYVPRLVGTRTTKRDEETRAWMLTDWLVRECAPKFLSVAGLTEQARLLEQLAPITSAKAARAAKLTLHRARKDSFAAGAAAVDAARAAAWAALAPTVKTLQASALLLLDRMIVVGADHG
jgi:hypothetical protein